MAVLYEGEYREEGDTKWLPLFTEQESPEYDWDTSDLYGTYEVRTRPYHTETNEKGEWDYLTVETIGDSYEFRNWFYDKIPDITRYRDQQAAGPGEVPTLKQLTDVLSLGMYMAKRDIEDFYKLRVVDECPAEYLPYLAGLFGYEFPHDLSVERQRNFLRSIAVLTATKGTARSMSLLATRIMGENFDVTVKNEDVQAKTFDVEVTAEQSVSTDRLETKLDYLIKQFTPAGLVPTVIIVYYFDEVIDPKLDDSFHETFEIAAWRTNFIGHQISNNIDLADKARLQIEDI